MIHKTRPPHVKNMCCPNVSIHMKNISISLVSMFTSYLYMNACACQSPRHVRLGHRVAWSCEVPLCHESILPKWKMESRFHSTVGISWAGQIWTYHEEPIS